MMDLSWLFEFQRRLDAEIEKKHPTEKWERVDKKFLALFTEIAECANEHRGFKFWSTDQKPRIKIENMCVTCHGTGDENYSNYEDNVAGGYTHEVIHCEDCDGTGKIGETNPLLEEYVDGIHFLLSLGLEFGFQDTDFQKELKDYRNIGTTFKERTITRQFNSVFYHAAQFESDNQEGNFVYLLFTYLVLGEMLGFSDKDIETAYLSKNDENHRRQDSGY